MKALRVESDSRFDSGFILCIFCALFVWIRFGLFVACVRVVYEIGHTYGFADLEVLNSAVLNHRPLCLKPRASDVDVRFCPLLANFNWQLLRFRVVFVHHSRFYVQVFTRMRNLRFAQGRCCNPTTQTVKV